MVLTLTAIEAELSLIRLYTRGYETTDGIVTRDHHPVTGAEVVDLKLSLARFEFLVLAAQRIRSSN